MSGSDPEKMAQKGDERFEGFSTETPNLGQIVDHLCGTKNGCGCGYLRDTYGHMLPNRGDIAELIECLRSVLFPGYFGLSELSDENVRFYVGSRLDRASRLLREQIRRALSYVCGHAPEDCATCDERSVKVTNAFLNRLPHIRDLLATDVQAAYDGDPAAKNYEEIIICYPTIQTVSNHRIAHELYRLDIPLLPRIISELAHSRTGIDIHPGATIGEQFFIDHGTGVVIGETCLIGKNVRIYQGVTLGAKSFPVDAEGNPVKGIPRHPIVEDEVIVYGGATILGRITIGKGSVIGGNVWLTESVQPGSRITQGRVRRESFMGGAGI